MKKSPGRQGTTHGRAAEVAAMLAGARAVLENSHFTDAARSILESCREILGADAGFVSVRMDGGSDFEIVLVVDVAGLQYDDSIPMPAALGRLRERALKSGGVVFANNLAAKNESNEPPSEGLPAAHCALLAPINLEGTVAGFVCMLNKPQGFSAADSRLAEVFAEIAAVAMRNSHTVDGLESSRSALEDEVHAGAAQLWQSEGKFRTLVDNLPDVVARYDTRLRHIYVSPAVKRVTGRPPEEFLGKTNLELGMMPPEQVRSWDAALERVLATGRPERLEFELQGPSANRHFDCRLVAERGPGGAIQSVLTVARDVTDRWLAYEAERRSRTVSDALRETTLLLTRSRDRESVLTTMLDCLRRLVPFDRARVMLLEDESRLSVRAIFDGNRVVPLTPEVRLELDASEHPVVREILANGNAVLIPDIRLRSDWSLPTDHESEASWMGVPLFARGDVAGLFSLSKYEPDYFSDEHMRLAEAMSSQASVAVENSVLFDQMQASTIRMQALSRRLVEVQEDERRHIARELHDEAGQALVSLRYGLRLLERQIDKGESVTERVAELVERTDAVIDGLHRLAADLRPASLDHLGLEAALRQYSRSIAASSGLAVRFKARGFSDERFGQAMETALYRVVQEAMANVVRHASATRVDIFAERGTDRLRVMVEDDGVGFDPDRVVGGNHFGLLGMKERAEALGGKLTVESTRGAGTTIVVEVPIDNSNSDR